MTKRVLQYNKTSLAHVRHSHWKVKKWSSALVAPTAFLHPGCCMQNASIGMAAFSTAQQHLFHVVKLLQPNAADMRLGILYAISPLPVTCPCGLCLA